MFVTFLVTLVAVLIARAAEVALGYYLGVRRQRRMQAAFAALIRESRELGLYDLPPATGASEPPEMN